MIDNHIKTLYWYLLITFPDNSLLPDYVIWHHITRSTLFLAPTHYLKQYWFIIHEVPQPEWILTQQQCGSSNWINCDLSTTGCSNLNQCWFVISEVPQPEPMLTVHQYSPSTWINSDLSVLQPESIVTDHQWSISNWTNVNLSSLRSFASHIYQMAISLHYSDVTWVLCCFTITGNLTICWTQQKKHQNSTSLALCCREKFQVIWIEHGNVQFSFLNVA